MKKVILTKILSLFLMFSCMIPQATAKELNLYYQEKLRPVVAHLIESSHRKLNLADIQFSYHEIESPEYFFESNFGLGRALLGKNHYKIGVNPLVFKEEIPQEALVGVMAHELTHTEDYVSGSTVGTLIPIGLKVLRKKSRRQYERKTDLRVVLKGLYRELLAYKRWQYPRLTKKDLEKKKKEYLTPEEIITIVKFQRDYPLLSEGMFKDWLENEIPLNITQLKLDIKSRLGSLHNDIFDVKIDSKRTSLRNRNRRNIRVGVPKKKFKIEISSSAFTFKKCKLEIYPKGEQGYFFNDILSFSIDEISQKKPFKKYLNFSQKISSTDFRIHSCKDMEGNGIFFGPESQDISSMTSVSKTRTGFFNPSN